MRGRIEGIVSRLQAGNILAKGVAMILLELEGKVDEGLKGEFKLCPGKGLSSRMEEVIG